MGTIFKFARLARHWVWLMPVGVGIAFIGGGAYMIIEGRSAHDEVRDSILREEITVSDDAPAFGGELVDSPSKADAQAEAILEHTLAATGGYLYAELGQYALPEGNYVLPNGTYMTENGELTTDVALAAKDSDGKPIITTTDEALAARNANDQPIRAWTSDKALAAVDATGSPVPNSLRNTAQTSAFLRTSLGVAVMGFKVSDLVVGLGAFLAVLGLMNVLIMAPATYWASVVADEHDRNRAKAPERTASRTA